MSATGGKIKLTARNRTNSADVSIELTRPLFGYETTVQMPISIKRMPNAKRYSFDNALTSEDNDARYCDCDFILTESEIASFESFMYGTNVNVRARDLTLILELDADGFFPFGADKGDVGDFTIALEVLKESTRLRKPLNRYSLSLRLHNVGAYPEYTLPTETGVGQVTFGTVSNLRYPDAFPQAKIKRTDMVTITGGRTAYIYSRDSSGRDAAIKKTDAFDVGMGFRLNESKVAALLAYITTTLRGAEFTFDSGAGSYPFGYAAGTSAFTAMLASNTIKITHNRFNDFRLSLDIGKQP